MNLSEIQHKLYERLKPSGWGNLMKAFILSPQFYNILETLYKESTQSRNFTPVIKDMFRAFEECPYDKLRVVIVGQDPYPTLGVADGISFSCSKTMKEQPSLRFIFDELTNQYPDIERNPDLKRWSNQGVLMLNTALTCQVGKAGSHVKIWENFITYLLQSLDDRYTGLIYVFLGKKAETWSSLVSSKYNYHITRKHPAAAAYAGGKWDSDNLFLDINRELNQLFGEEIKW